MTHRFETAAALHAAVKDMPLVVKFLTTNVAVTPDRQNPGMTYLNGSSADMDLKTLVDKLKPLTVHAWKGPRGAVYATLDATPETVRQVQKMLMPNTYGGFVFKKSKAEPVMVWVGGKKPTSNAGNLNWQAFMGGHYSLLAPLPRDWRGEVPVGFDKRLPVRVKLDEHGKVIAVYSDSPGFGFGKTAASQMAMA